MSNMAGLLRWKGGVAALIAAACMLGWVHPAYAVERQFLGIRMLSKVQNVLARFGNPTQVTVGQVAYNLPGQQAGIAGTVGMPGRAGMAGLPGVPGVPGAPSFAGSVPGAGIPSYAGVPGMPPMAGGAALGGRAGSFGFGGGAGLQDDDMPPMGGPMMGAPTMGGPMMGAPTMGGPMMGGPRMGGMVSTGAPGLPSLPGGIGSPMAPGAAGMPGMAGFTPMGGAPGMAGTVGGGLPYIGLRGTAGGTMLEQETTIIYQRPGGVIYEFLVNKDGYVVQVKAIGYEDKSGLARTSRGIKLGDTYQKVVATYGWPKETQSMGATLYVRYPQHHVAFQFYDNKVVSIIVAAME